MFRQRLYGDKRHVQALIAAALALATALAVASLASLSLHGMNAALYAVEPADWERPDLGSSLL